MKQTFELAVIGAGPAGLEAAITASAAGVNTVLIDSSPRAGGQYYKSLPPAFRPAQLTGVEREGRNLVSRLKSTPVRQVYDASVWGVFREESGEGWLVTLNVCGTPQQIHARYLILANGAYDTPLAFPGWTLPGVITCGAVLTLLKNQRVAPFHRVLVSGSGPLLLSVAAHLVEAGVQVVSVCESNHIPLKVVTRAPTLLREWHRMEEGARYLATLARARVPYQLGCSVTAALGKDRVEESIIARVNADGTPVGGSSQSFQVDAVVCGYGLTPNTGLARMMGCKFEYHSNTHTWLPWRDQNLSSSLPGVYLAGDGAGIGGAENARLEGQVAATAVALESSHIDRQNKASFDSRIKNQLAQQRRFGRFLEEFFSPRPGLLTLAQDDTIICRCEEITLGEVKAAVADGARTLGEVKMVTRAGMGNCQGRMCESSVAGAIVREVAREQATPESTGMYSVRPPLFPLPVGFLIKANLEE